MKRRLCCIKNCGKKIENKLNEKKRVGVEYFCREIFVFFCYYLFICFTLFLFFVFFLFLYVFAFFAVYQGNIDFKKEVPKSSHSTGQNWMSKIQSFSYRIRKVNTNKIFSTDIHKIKKSKLTVSSSHSLVIFACLGNYRIERLCVCFFIFQMSICMEKIKMMSVYSLSRYISSKNSEP